jgi:flagellin
MSSILTNNGAMVALQILKSINSNLTNTQNAISTGKEVATAKDNASVWAISKVMESDVSGLDAVSDSLAVGKSAIAVASAGAELIVETIKDMQALDISAQSESANFTQIDAEMTAKKEQLDSIVASSQFKPWCPPPWTTFLRLMMTGARFESALISTTYFHPRVGIAVEQFSNR